MIFGGKWTVSMNSRIAWKQVEFGFVQGIDAKCQWMDSQMDRFTYILCVEVKVTGRDRGDEV